MQGCSLFYLTNERNLSWVLWVVVRSRTQTTQYSSGATPERFSLKKRAVWHSSRIGAGWARSSEQCREAGAYSGSIRLRLTRACRPKVLCCKRLSYVR